MVSNCWLNSLYSFEYTWINAGWTLDQRLEYFETHWAYFLGFGSPFAFIIWLAGLPPVFKCAGAAHTTTHTHSAALFALCFPWFIVTAVAAKPVARHVPGV